MNNSIDYSESFVDGIIDTLERDGTLKNFERYAELDDAEAEKTAIEIWTRINLKNLNENILPTRARADLILHKSGDHHIDRVLLRKI